MEVKLLKKIRKRFVLIPPEQEHGMWKYYDKKKNIERYARHDYMPNNEAVLFRLMEILGLEGFWASNSQRIRRRERLRSEQNLKMKYAEEARS